MLGLVRICNHLRRLLCSFIYFLFNMLYLICFESLAILNILNIMLKKKHRRISYCRLSLQKGLFALHRRYLAFVPLSRSPTNMENVRITLISYSQKPTCGHSLGFYYLRYLIYLIIELMLMA